MAGDWESLTALASVLVASGKKLSIDAHRALAEGKQSSKPLREWRILRLGGRARRVERTGPEPRRLLRFDADRDDLRRQKEIAMANPAVTPPNPILAGITGRCPRCGKGRLFAGFLGQKSSCERCGLDYSFVDAGDGPAVFVIMISGFIVVGGALAVEMLYAPPFWVHAALWVPLVIITGVLPLRPIKGILIALQYHHRIGR